MAIGRLYISITLFPPSVRSWEKVEIELKVTLLKASTSSRSSFTEETPGETPQQRGEKMGSQEGFHHHHLLRKGQSEIFTPSFPQARALSNVPLK